LSKKRKIRKIKSTPLTVKYSSLAQKLTKTKTYYSLVTS
jgi:hypothetical protein